MVIFLYTTEHLINEV